MVLGNSHDMRMIVFRKSYSSYDTVDGSEIWLTSWHGTLSHYLQGFTTIPGGCWGFLNHQQYYRKSYSITAWNPKQQFVNGCFSWISSNFFFLGAFLEITISIHPSIHFPKNCWHIGVLFGGYILGVSPTHLQWNNNLFIFMKGPLETWEENSTVSGGWGYLQDIFFIWLVVSDIFYVHPENWGWWTHFDEHIFQFGLVQPPKLVIFLHLFCLRWNLRISGLRRWGWWQLHDPLGMRWCVLRRYQYAAAGGGT